MATPQRGRLLGETGQKPLVTKGEGSPARGRSVLSLRTVPSILTPLPRGEGAVCRVEGGLGESRGGLGPSDLRRLCPGRARAGRSWAPWQTDAPSPALLTPTPTFSGRSSVDPGASLGRGGAHSRLRRQGEGCGHGGGAAPARGTKPHGEGGMATGHLPQGSGREDAGAGDGANGGVERGGGGGGLWSPRPGGQG